MKGILKPLFDFFVDGFTFFENPLYNLIAAGIVGAIAYGVAWSFVGFLYNSQIIFGRSAGSLIHWTVRAIVFALVFFIYALLINLVRFIITVPLWIWVSLGAIIIAGSLFILVRRRHNA